MFDELFPGTIDQLNKLTVIRYDHIQETNAQRDEKVVPRVPNTLTSLRVEKFQVTLC